MAMAAAAMAMAAAARAMVAAAMAAAGMPGKLRLVLRRR
jgi:hypothetical protein